MGTKLFDYLAKIDSMLANSDRPSVPGAERRAFLLSREVCPDEGRGYDWLVSVAMAEAKYIHHEKSAAFACFIFTDRSVLVLLEAGYLLPVESAEPEGLLKIDAWLASRGIGVPTPDAANDPID